MTMNFVEQTSDSINYWKLFARPLKLRYIEQVMYSVYEHFFGSFGWDQYE